MSETASPNEGDHPPMLGRAPCAGAPPHLGTGVLCPKCLLVARAAPQGGMRSTCPWSPEAAWVGEGDGSIQAERRRGLRPNLG